MGILLKKRKAFEFYILARNIEIKLNRKKSEMVNTMAYSSMPWYTYAY